MKKAFAYGGIAASVVLILFGIGAIGVGIAGFDEVRDTIARENITATDDAAEIPGVNLVPGQKIDTGPEAKEFAEIMRHHALDSTDGLTYAEMGRFQSAANPGDPKGTSDEALAAKDPETGRPVDNGLRQLWVTETALSTALNTSFLAERIALFSIVMGAALLLTGIGFLVLTLGGALGAVPVRRRGTAKSGAVAAV
jgi:hypothetical protein